MNALFDWTIARLSEVSTWRGIIGILTSAGVYVSPDRAAAIIAVGMALIGLINVVRSEKKPTPTPPNEIPNQNPPVPAAPQP
jgi:hypothetical protein